MIEIGRLPNSRAAQALIDYLKGLHIDCELMPTEQGVALMIHDQKHFDRAQREFQAFIHNPYDEKYLAASWENGDTHTKLDYGNPSLQLVSQFITGAGPLTLLVFFTCVIIYGAMNLGYANPIFDQLSFFGATPSATLSEFWRIFTPSLLHFSAMHIIFNLLWWWYLGGKIENKLGFTPLFILLIVGGTLPNILQYYMAGPGFGGLSGVVYAVVGYTWVMGVRRPESGIGLPPAYIGFMLLWLVFGFTDMFGLSIANGAHLGGLLVGVIQGFVDSKTRKI
ncbi:rhomboid family intramembrane serine protease GlpG [Shewanella schlegeliana]|uniref:Rhomboid family intramembrane serine protease GlpG n=1 Tax=Shewanella schlegeliana TaxID=190308 RepID=A0ABS1T379_9GAMM|nr:rhomboid family intramembrane serine protease GlpG [Shewanella schlegeliana]MBL4915253.1 rhomboid family intramembrane serine protease GlpG [Shewanella schlegeliana]MCL1111236.1 rhomboid family intramembrane serine protease GlpG [Shewanella schlegeliana]GIU34078.1 rhomboid family intramembrane serine protease GlpG [Shewanella schlegeliana]